MNKELISFVLKIIIKREYKILNENLKFYILFLMLLITDWKVYILIFLEISSVIGDVLEIFI